MLLSVPLHYVFVPDVMELLFVEAVLLESLEQRLVPSKAHSYRVSLIVVPVLIQYLLWLTGFLAEAHSYPDCAEAADKRANRN